MEATISGRQVDVGAPKQRALLALLASQAGQPVTVDVMLEALWTGNPPPSAMASLHAYVANLRKLLEPGRAPRTPATVLRTCPGGYLLDAGSVDVDVRWFGDHAAAGWQAWDREDPQQALREFEAGLALWRGHAYPEVAHAPCVLPEVARLEELRLSVVEMRNAALLAVGAHEVAVAELGAFMKANPLREYGCELLSLALYRSGRQAEALEVLRTIQTRLTDELGLDPRPALQHLKREILNQAPSLDWRPISAAETAAAADEPVFIPQARGPATPPKPETSDGVVFVGRQTALQPLTEALSAAEAGRGQVVLVSGEPDIGKTSLLRRFTELIDGPALWGTCPEHVSTPPLWLWEQVLRAAASAFPYRSVPRPVAGLLDGEAGRPADGAGADGVLLRRFEAVVAYLTELSQLSPLMVVLDHVHRADPSSLRLLAHLAESVPASRLLLVVSYRSDEAENLVETVAALAHRETTRIDLKGLSVQETRTLASALVRRKVGEHTAEGLRDRTEGNPFFLRELVKELRGEDGLGDPFASPVPAPVREVALRRIARLPRPAAEVLSVAATVGRHFVIEVVAEVLSIEIDETLEILDTAIAAGLVEEDEERLGWFRFTHVMVAEALDETTGRLRRARLRRRIGAATNRAWARDAVWAAETVQAAGFLMTPPSTRPDSAWPLAAVPAADISDARPAKEAAQW
ncbi:MAG: BTAD domain-containing putative transcriptional regulator [Actinophytocola sp.]|uniref:BTAD domain-containing putative transcriptional regulator n=1 Tax=Actinophytocola sp. TaxID=1872138 RepID=UPI003D6BE51D